MKTHDLIFRGCSVPDLSEYQHGALVLVECTAREYHQTVCRLEDLGWEVRDSLKIVYTDRATHQYALLRKPLLKSASSIAANTLTHRTGVLNIEASRISPESDAHGGSTSGRFPTNLFLAADETIVSQFPESQAGVELATKGSGGMFSEGTGVPCGPQYGDSGSAARFFYQFENRLELLDYLQTLITPPEREHHE